MENCPEFEFLGRHMATVLKEAHFRSLDFASVVDYLQVSLKNAGFSQPADLESYLKVSINNFPMTANNRAKETPKGKEQDKWKALARLNNFSFTPKN